LSEAFSVVGVIDALKAQPVRDRSGGRALMLVSARRGEGVTTVARSVAQASGPGAVYAVDLDLKRNALAKAFSQSEPLGPKIDGRLGGASFYAVLGPGRTMLRELAPAFTYHRVGRSLVFAGVFDARRMPRNSRVAISRLPDYWNAARTGGATIIVDAPALERSDVALRVAPHMDGVVLVVGAEPGGAPAAIAAKQSLEKAGANVIGLVYAGATAPVMAIERLLRQAG
jgi:Mrp family chromosome partitioning ATPase